MRQIKLSNLVLLGVVGCNEGWTKAHGLVTVEVHSQILMASYLTNKFWNTGNTESTAQYFYLVNFGHGCETWESKSLLSWCLNSLKEMFGFLFKIDSMNLSS